MFNEIVVQNFLEPIYSGEIENPQIEYEIGNTVCGDRIKIQILIQNGIISRGVFRAWGCATSVATANIFCSSISGSNLKDIFCRSRSEISKMIGDLEPSQYHCLDLLNELHIKLETISVEMGLKL